MRGKMPANFRNRREAFSLIEILIVCTIMAIIVGVVGTLLAGYMRMFNETDDQAVAKQRAIDVFNALELPISQAALGIPTFLGGDPPPTGSPMTYFDLSSAGGPKAPIADWAAPIDIRDTRDYGVISPDGDVLRLVFSVPTGVKNGPEIIRDFMEPGIDFIDYVAVTGTGGGLLRLDLTADLTADMVVPAAFGSSVADTRSFITSPNAYSSPLLVRNNIPLPNDSINVAGKRQPQAVPVLNARGDTTYSYNRGEIMPFQDLHAVRAVAAYVDDQRVFHAAEVNNADVTANNPAAATDEAVLTALRDAPGLRVEGIRAVRFEVDDDRRLLTVRVLAEGEIVDNMRSAGTPTRTALAGRWPGVALDDRIYYEDFGITWRIRNYVPVP